MKLEDMKIGTALLVKKEEGVNTTFDGTIKEGEWYIEVRLDKDTWEEYKLMEQPKKKEVKK